MLRAAGYTVREELFTYSDAPGRIGTPVAGVWTALTLGAVSIAGARGRPGLALAALALGASALAGVGAWVARVGTVRLGWRRRAGINLVATRGTPASPTTAVDSLPGPGIRVWLVAHLDTKSQPVPMVVRVGGVIAAIGCAAVSSVIAGAELAAGRALVGTGGWVALGVLGVASAVPIVATTVGVNSDGALDNASGVAAVLGAVEALAVDGMLAGESIGVLLTSAEELGLAGAHAWADAWERAGRAPAIALNCDGVDDAGPLTLLRGGRGAASLARALGAEAAGVRVRRIPPGLLVDAVALALRGWETVTVSRGTWGTLARIHSRRDTLAQLRGSGIGDAAALLARLAGVLTRSAAVDRRE